MAFKIVYTILAIISVASTISEIGKPRKPITAGHAGLSFAIAGVLVTLVWVFL